MPPQYQSSDSDSDPDVIYPTKKVVKQQEVVAEEEPSDAEVEAEEDGENGNESEAAEDEYTVEAIMDHKFDGEVP
jgi:hypothetical protein